MSKLLFTLSSPIIRNNGINTFIRETTKILREAGHTVDFMTDNEPDLDIRSYFNNFYCPIDKVEYPISLQKNEWSEDKTDTMPDIKYLPHISNRIRDIWNILDQDSYDVIISSDAQCTAALIDTGKVIHYVHTAALLDGKNYTCLNDSYIQFERDLMKYCPVAVQTHECIDMINDPDVEFLVLGLPLSDYDQYLKQPDDESEGVLFVGEGSYRKGADLYKQNTYALPKPRKLILSAEPEISFDSGYDKRTFINDEINKQKFIRSAKVSYFPSRSEVMPYGVLETLLSQPVIVHIEYPWTKNVLSLGAIGIHSESAISVITKYAVDDIPYNPSKIIKYFKDSKEQWLSFAKNL